MGSYRRGRGPYRPGGEDGLGKGCLASYCPRGSRQCSSEGHLFRGWARGCMSGLGHNQREAPKLGCQGVHC
jgi:hypothetical protein